MGGDCLAKRIRQVLTILNHTIVSGNRNNIGEPNNIGGYIDSNSSFNLYGSGGGVILPSMNNISSDNPSLLPLAFYGGPTKTHLPIINETDPSTDAIDAGDPSLSSPPLVYDQRGEPFVRVLDGEETIIARGLSMPNSPRWHAGRLWILESGRGGQSIE